MPRTPCGLLVLALCLGVTLAGRAAQEPAAPVPLVEVGDDEPKLDRLQKAKYNQVAAEMNQRLAEIEAGIATPPPDVLLDNVQRLLESTADLPVSREERARLFRAQFRVLDRLGEREKARRKIGAEVSGGGERPSVTMRQIRYFRLEAEIRLLKSQEKKGEK